MAMFRVHCSSLWVKKKNTWENYFRLEKNEKRIKTCDQVKVQKTISKNYAIVVHLLLYYFLNICITLHCCSWWLRLSWNSLTIQKTGSFQAYFSRSHIHNQPSSQALWTVRWEKKKLTCILIFFISRTTCYMA